MRLPVEAWRARPARAMVFEGVDGKWREKWFDVEWKPGVEKTRMAVIVLGVVCLQSSCHLGRTGRLIYMR